MKKVLVTMAALGLVAGVASTASAVEWKMSGKYLVEGAYLSDARGTGMDVTEAAGESTPSDAYWLHTFETNVNMKVNDKISMSSVVRLADDSFWGTQTDGDVSGGNNMATASTRSGVYVHQLYMDYLSPIGKARFGRTPAGGYGTAYMDFDKRADRIMLWPAGLAKPLSTLFYIEKAKDNFADAGQADNSDNDSDTYVARLYYNTDTTDAGIHYGYTNDKTGLTNDDNQKNQLTAYGKFKLDNYFVNAELTHFFGSKTTAVDYDSWAGMAQAGGKFGNLTASLMFFYAEGQDTGSTDDDAALGTAGTGDLFEPLYILTGRHTGMLNNDLFTNNTSAMSNGGVEAYVVAADYKVSDALSLHGAIGYAQANEKYNGTVVTADDEYGWEYNIGAAYKLLDNLTYEAHFGYLDTGDFFNGAVGQPDTTENVYLLSHSLTMTF
jgi:hypothetical protein